MNAIILSILAIASLASIACSLLGSFLMLRGVGLMSDAMSHAILPGIVIMFLMVQSLESPLLITGASLAGILTVLIIEYIIHTNRLNQDAAIGFVFPFFFSIGVLLICAYTRNVHLDTDMVILGEIAFCPFKRLFIYGYDCGPHALWSVGTIALINLSFVCLFYKQLAIATFDHTLARVQQCHPTVFYYALMILTSITAVGTFNIVGSIVVVTLMLAPPATAYLLTTRLPTLLIGSCLIGIISAALGYAMAHYADISIAGSIATANGLLFIITFLCAPRTGLLSTLIYSRTHQATMAIMTLLNYLESSSHPQTIDTLAHQLGWSHSYTQKIIDCAVAQKYIIIGGDIFSITLTPHGIASLYHFHHKI